MKVKYSGQHGHTLAFLTEVLPVYAIIPRHIVEVGSGDGVFFSNSIFWIEVMGWSAHLIEGSIVSYIRSLHYYSNDSNVEITNGIVAPDETGYIEVTDIEPTLTTFKKDVYGRCGLLLSQIISKRPVGILSIDINGYETEVINEMFMHSLNRPFLICIENQSDLDLQAQSNILTNNGYIRKHTLEADTVWIDSYVRRTLN